MTIIREIAFSGTTEEGPFSGGLRFSDGLNLISARNGFGKSLCAKGLIWCLGLEPTLGAANNDASIFPGAVRDALDVAGGERNVLTAEARLTLVRGERAIRLRRAIHGGPLDAVEVDDLDSEGSVTRTTRLFARKGTMTDESGGLQRFLYEFLGLPRVNVMTNRGKASEIYLENLAPLFYVDQTEGWTEIQAQQVYRYGQTEIAEAAVEYILGARDALAARLRDQEADARESRLKAEADVIAAQVIKLFADHGFTVSWSTWGTVSAISDRWEQRLRDLARKDFQYDVIAEQKRWHDKAEALKLQLRQPPDVTNMGSAARASQSVLDLKARRHEISGQLRVARGQLKDQQGLAEAIAHRLHSSEDVLRLKQMRIGRFEAVECPTCHRLIDPSAFSLSEQSTEQVTAYIEAQRKEKFLIETNVRSTEREITRLVAELKETEQRLMFAQRELSAVSAAAGTAAEVITKINYDLGEAEREYAKVRAFGEEIDLLQNAVDAWRKSAGPTEAAEAKSLDGAWRETFLGKLRTLLVALGHSAVPTAKAVKVALDDNYVPYLETRRLRSLGSASDQPRLVASYVLGLAQAAGEIGATALHPGFVFLDEPLQQNPDPTRRKQALTLFEGLSALKTGQTIILTSLEDVEIDRLREKGVNVKALTGEHLLVMSEAPPTAAVK